MEKIIKTFTPIQNLQNLESLHDEHQVHERKELEVATGRFPVVESQAHPSNYHLPRVFCVLRTSTVFDRF